MDYYPGGQIAVRDKIQNTAKGSFFVDQEGGGLQLQSYDGSVITEFDTTGNKWRSYIRNIANERYSFIYKEDNGRDVELDDINTLKDTSYGTLNKNPNTKTYQQTIPYIDSLLQDDLTYTMPANGLCCVVLNVTGPNLSLAISINDMLYCPIYDNIAPGNICFPTVFPVKQGDIIKIRIDNLGIINGGSVTCVS